VGVAADTDTVEELCGAGQRLRQSVGQSNGAHHDGCSALIGRPSVSNVDCSTGAEKAQSHAEFSCWLRKVVNEGLMSHRRTAFLADPLAFCQGRLLT
jgi:hypothetical protein